MIRLFTRVTMASAIALASAALSSQYRRVLGNLADFPISSQRLRLLMVPDRTLLPTNYARSLSFEHIEGRSHSLQIRNRLRAALQVGGHGASVCLLTLDAHLCTGNQVVNFLYDQVRLVWLGI